MTILITVPVYNTPQDLFEKCVSSLLEQTYTDICLLILGDGATPSISSNDSRLVMHTLSQNRGRYFADAVAQRASPFEFYAPHDSDDYSEPGRLDDLMSHIDRGDGAVWSDHINHSPSGATSRMTFPRATMPLGPRQQRQGCHLGLYRIDRLYLTGMYHPEFRVHYDSLHNSLIKMTGKVAVSPNALYHRVKWSGSLTLAPQTRLAGPYRQNAAARCRSIYTDAWQLYQKGRPEKIASLITSTIGDETLDAVEAETEALRKALT